MKQAIGRACIGARGPPCALICEARRQPPASREAGARRPSVSRLAEERKAGGARAGQGRAQRRAHTSQAGGLAMGAWWRAAPTHSARRPRAHLLMWLCSTQLGSGGPRPVMRSGCGDLIIARPLIAIMPRRSWQASQAFRYHRRSMPTVLDLPLRSCTSASCSAHQRALLPAWRLLVRPSQFSWVRWGTSFQGPGRWRKISRRDCGCTACVLVCWMGRWMFHRTTTTQLSI